MNQHGFEFLRRNKIKNLEITFPDFTTCFPWVGGDLQTIRSTIFPLKGTQLLKMEKNILFPLQDGGNLIGKDNEPTCDPLNKTIVLLHGMGGHSESFYMVAAANYFINLGWRVIRLNLRGAGASQKTSVGQYHAGLSKDLNDIFINGPKEVLGKGVSIMGFSLGANTLLKYLGEHHDYSSVNKVVAISPPVCLEITQRTIQALRNRPYRKYLLKKLKSDFYNTNWGPYSWGGLNIKLIKTIKDYDDKVIASYHGFQSAIDYYEQSSSKNFVKSIENPTLIIHAKNDPWIPVSIFRGINWKECDKVIPILTESGGHLGFHTRGHNIPWHLRAADTFLGSA